MPVEIGEIPRVMLSLSWADRAYLGLLGAGLAGLVTLFTNYLQSQRDRKARNIENVAQEFLSLLSELDHMIKEFWGSSRAELGWQREMVLSVSIAAAQQHIDECLSLMFNLKESFPKKVFFKKKHLDQRKELQDIITEITRRTTSEAFAEDDREASRNVISQSVNEILKLRIRFQKFIYQ